MTPADLKISRWEFIALAAALTSINALSIDIMLPALTDIGSSLGVGHPNEYPLVITAYLFGFGLGQLLLGPISDAMGRRMPLFVGTGIFVASAILAAIAPNFAILLALRFVQGVASAASRIIASAVIRDLYKGREMAEVLSLVIAVFMAVPVFAPSLGQLIILVLPWPFIFIFMGLIALLFCLWAYWRLPETLEPQDRRSLAIKDILGGFVDVCTNRIAFFYGLASLFIFGALFGFINATPQIYVGIFDLGPLFPIAFSTIAFSMIFASLINARMVKKFGMRRISHFAMIFYTLSGLAMFAAFSLWELNVFVFTIFMMLVMFNFGWIASNSFSLALESMGHVAGTATSVLGFMQTVGGAVIGIMISAQFDGAVAPIALGMVLAGIGAIICALIAEKGKLFGVGEDYQ